MATSAPIEQEFGGKTYKVSPMTLLDIQNVNNKMRADFITAARISNESCANSAERRDVLDAAMKQAGRLSMFTPVRLEISRIIPSKLSDMLGQTIENVPRFKMIFEEGNVLYSVKFSSDSSTPNSFGTDEEFEIYNPRRIYDYTEPQANG